MRSSDLPLAPVHGSLCTSRDLRPRSAAETIDPRTCGYYVTEVAAPQGIISHDAKAVDYRSPFVRAGIKSVIVRQLFSPLAGLPVPDYAHTLDDLAAPAKVSAKLAVLVFGNGRSGGMA